MKIQHLLMTSCKALSRKILSKTRLLYKDKFYKNVFFFSKYVIIIYRQYRVDNDEIKLNDIDV